MPSTFPDGTPAGGYFLLSGSWRADVRPEANGFKWQVTGEDETKEGRSATLEAAKAAAMHAMLELESPGFG
ncbi:hypothetical protein [Arenibaculum pallidiluteum]|uniref:hypothetical protein n=1 Tax=Arenibaculum pallidiluteum TaxID=2812559 RepID=UPI001A95937F|nr:hypothetical protein [Arenibaculum pallidiluteum]